MFWCHCFSGLDEVCATGGSGRF
jgi:hypothetical protein